MSFTSMPAIFNNMLNKASATAGLASSKREAIKWAREEANAIIDQAERQAKGWDKGMYRDDDVTCRGQSIRYTQAMHSMVGFALSARFA